MAEDKRNIDDFIRDGFDQNDSGFSFDSWDEISNRLDQPTNLDESIAVAFDDQAAVMPTDGWSDVKEELDIDTVWTRINRKLNKRKRRAVIWWNAAAISAILLLGGYLFRDEIKSTIASDNDVTIEEPNNTELNNSVKPVLDSQEGLNSSEITNQENSISLIDEDQDNLPVDHISDYNSNQSIVDNYISNDNIVSTIVNYNLPDNNTVAQNDPQRTGISDVSVIDPSNISLIDYDINEVMKPLIEFPGKDEIPPLRTSKWTLGIMGSVDNAFVSDAKLRESYSKFSLVSNNFVVSLNYGVFAQYYLKKGYYLDAEFYFNSRTKRSVNEYRDLSYIRHDKVLDYYKADISIGKQISFGKTKTNSVNLATGPYVSFLKSDKEFTNSLLISNDGEHKSIDFGINIQLGLQKDWDRLSMGYGIHSSIGLKNIFEGSPDQSAFLNRSQIFSNGLYFRLGYRL